MLGWLRSCWRTQEKAGLPIEVVLYTRQGCHLCDDAWQLLEAARQQYALHLCQVDVDADPDLQTAYGQIVPVISVNGRVRFQGRINSVLLDRLLWAESRG